MNIQRILALALTALALVAPSAHAFVLRVGDSVFVDGKQYTWEEWKKIRDTYQRKAPPSSAGSATSGEPMAMSKPQPPAAAGEPRAASCNTRGAFDEFPADDERFDCSSGLGLHTRDDLLRQGWKIDLVEKIPAAGEARSPR